MFRTLTATLIAVVAALALAACSAGEPVVAGPVETPLTSASPAAPAPDPSAPGPSGTPIKVAVQGHLDELDGTLSDLDHQLRQIDADLAATKEGGQ